MKQCDSLSASSDKDAAMTGYFINDIARHFGTGVNRSHIPMLHEEGGPSKVSIGDGLIKTKLETGVSRKKSIRRIIERQLSRQVLRPLDLSSTPLSTPFVKIDPQISLLSVRHVTTHPCSFPKPHNVRLSAPYEHISSSGASRYESHETRDQLLSRYESIGHTSRRQSFKNLCHDDFPVIGYITTNGYFECKDEGKEKENGF